MTVTVYHYPKCSTCRRALAWLDARGVTHTRIDLVASPPSAKTLRAIWEASAEPLAKLFNTSGQSYRAPGMKERLTAMDDAQKLAALAADGKLIRRPVLVGEGVTVLGFDEARYASLFAP